MFRTGPKCGSKLFWTGPLSPRSKKASDTHTLIPSILHCFECALFFLNSIYQVANYFFQQQKLEQLKKEQEKEKKKAVTSSISSILKAKERSTKKQPVVKTDSDEDDEMEVSTKGERTSITNI